MRQFDLERPFRGAGPSSEDLEDEPGPIDNFAPEASFEVALLHRRQRTIHDHQVYGAVFDLAGYRLDLALAKVSGWTDGAQGDDFRARDMEIDGLGEPHSFIAPRFGTAQWPVFAPRNPGRIGTDNERPRARGDSPLPAVDLGAKLGCGLVVSARRTRPLQPQTWLSD